MNNKIIAFLIAFIIPLFFFFVIDYLDILNIMGRGNQPKLKRYIAITPENDIDSTYAVRVNDTLWHTVPPFSFDGHTGQKITEQTFKNKIIVTDFFFTHCPGICPKMTKQLTRVQQEFRDDDEVMILSHTVDPARDTIQRLIEYADMYEADSTKWIFVTGTKKDLYHQARKGYFITATEGDGGEEDFVHSEKIVLVDKNRIIRGYYDGTNPEEVNRLMVAIKLLKLEYM